MKKDLKDLFKDKDISESQNFNSIKIIFLSDILVFKNFC